jgi:two-component system cell cycle sensor histidine kinase/response regulator CckA
MNVAAREAADPVGSETVAPPLILVVDDDDQVRDFITAVLRHEARYAVIEARNGVEALALLPHLRTVPDLVITDVKMPRMDGRTLGDEIARYWPGLPVLYMSGDDGGPHSGLRALHPLMTKPLHPDGLLRLLRTILSAKI